MIWIASLTDIFNNFLITRKNDLYRPTGCFYGPCNDQIRTIFFSISAADAGAFTVSFTVCAQSAHVDRAPKNDLVRGTSMLKKYDIDLYKYN